MLRAEGSSRRNVATQGIDNEVVEPLVGLEAHGWMEENFATEMKKRIRGDTQGEGVRDNLKMRKVFEGHIHDRETARRLSCLTARKVKDGVTVSCFLF